MNKKQAVEYFGSQAEIARTLGLGRAAVSAWKKIPIERQCQIEVITGGALKADRTLVKIRPPK